MPDARSMIIVIADDDEDDRSLACAALEDAEVPAEVHLVHDGVELMEYLRRPDAETTPRPDVVLLDLNMPRMDGHEALAKIKQDPALRSIPVVVFTTSRNADSIDTTYDLGGNSYIPKPRSFPELIDVMRSFSRYWAGSVCLPSRA